MGEAWRHKPRKKRSAFWFISTERLAEIVSESNSFSDVMRRFGFAVSGNSMKILKERVENDHIDHSHFLSHSFFASKASKRWWGKNQIPLEQILVKNSTYSRHSLKKRLIEEGLLENRCADPNCPANSTLDLDGTWNGKPLVLVLDHINGVRDDNRISNLQLLCPNCNSQTDTFCTRGLKQCQYCIDCGIEVTKRSKRCRKCEAGRPRRRAGVHNASRKVKNRPTKTVLRQQVKTLGYCGTGRLYGVTDNAIRKWLGLR